MTLRPMVRTIGRVGLVVLLGLVVALLTLMVLIPRLMGWVPLTIMSGSMEPALPVGSQVVVEPINDEADASQIHVGDVITFMPNPDDDTLVTHRVVGQGVRVDGTTTFTTRGDANGADDPEPVGAHQIRGEVRYHIPLAGYVATFLNPRQKGIGTIVFAGVLFGYAGWQVFESGRARRKPRRAADVETAASGE